MSAFTLTAVAISVFLAFSVFRLPKADFDAFLARNALDSELRKRLLLQLCGVAAAAFAVVMVTVVRFRSDGEYWLSRAAARMSPFVLACFVPTLLNYRQWYSEPFPYLILLLGVVLLLERLFGFAVAGSVANSRPGLVSVNSPAAVVDARPLARYLPLGIVAIAALGYALQASYYTIMRHQLLGTAGFDLGIFDNLMFNALHFRPFRSTVAVPNGSYLSNHAEYGMFLFVPLYWLRPGAETLLVLQSCSIALAAIPLYFFATTQISRPLSAALACSYLFFAAVHGPNYYDFHWMPQSMVFFFWLFHAIATGKKRSIWLLTPVICSIREDAAFGLIATGLFLLLTGFRPMLGGVLAVVSTAWFVLVKFVIMPWAGPWWFADIYKALIVPGEQGYGSVVKTILSNPNYFLKQLLTKDKAIYALHLLAPLAFLPVRQPALWVLMLPGFAVTLMTTGYAPTISIAFQYTTHWIPFLFAGAAIALHLRGARRGPAAVRASVIAVCFGVLCHSYVFGAVLQHETFVGGFSRVKYEITPAEQQRYRNLKELVAMIPPDASVAASELEIPHVSTRLDAYTLKVTAGKAEYLLLNRFHLDDDSRARVRDTFADARYGLVAKKAEFYLFKKGHTSEGTSAAWAALGMHRLAETPQHRDPGSLVGPGGNCVSMDASRGPGLVVLGCKREPKQRWVLSLRDGKLKYEANPELCLGASEFINFAPLRALPCDATGTSWAFDGIAIHHYSEKCVDLLGGNRANGAELGVWNCLLNSNQKWSISSVGEVRLGSLSGGKCWTMTSSEVGARVQLNDCDGTASQRFAFSANKIRHGENCLELRSDTPGGRVVQNGQRIQLGPCVEQETSQEFHFSGPITQRGKCVDSTYAQTTDGSPVGIWDCVGNNNQLFDLHF